jgi:hypothetical protein
MHLGHAAVLPFWYHTAILASMVKNVKQKVVLTRADQCLNLDKAVGGSSEASPTDSREFMVGLASLDPPYNEN